MTYKVEGANGDKLTVNAMNTGLDVAAGVVCCKLTHNFLSLTFPVVAASYPCHLCCSGTSPSSGLSHVSQEDVSLTTSAARACVCACVFLWPSAETRRHQHHPGSTWTSGFYKTAPSRANFGLSRQFQQVKKETSYCRGLYNTCT